MENDDFGEAHFDLEKKGIKRGITCYGTILRIEDKYILFKDNDDILYLVEKDNFTFMKHEKNENHNQ